MNAYNVLVKNGYCEDSNNGWLWLNLHSEKRLTNRQIYEELAEVARACARTRCSRPLDKHNDCPEIKEDIKFCSTCGIAASEIEDIKLEDSEALNTEAAEVLRELQSLLCHNVRQEFVELFEDRGWSIWGQPINGRMVFLTAPDRALEGYTTFPEIESKRVTFK